MNRVHELDASGLHVGELLPLVITSFHHYYNIIMRPQRHQYEPMKSWYAQDNLFLRRRVVNAYLYVVLMILFPYVSVKSFGICDRLPIWEQRVRKKEL